MKQTYIQIIASTVLIPVILFASSALAQEKNAHSLDEVVVTASRSPRKQSEIGRVVRVINSKQLLQSQGRTLPEVLNNVAGLTLSGSGGGFGSNISVYTRGAAAGYTLILIDGIPVNNSSGITSEYDISSFAIDQIERVEILRGVNSTLYGSDAVAGVINIITKKPSADKLNADVLLSAGNYGSHKEAIGLNGTKNKTGIAVNFSNTATDGFSIAKDATGNSSFDKDGLNQLALNSRINQELTDRLSLSANLQLTQNKFDLDAGAFTDDANYTGKNTFLFGGLNLKYNLRKGVLNVNVNQNNVWNNFINLAGGGDNGSAKQRNTGKITYSEAVLNQQLVENLDLTAGLNYRDTKSDQVYESLSDFGPYNSYLSSDSANNSIFSGFASLFFHNKAGFNFELGGRYNNHSEYGNNYTYTINPSYVIVNRYKIFASLASAYKVPSLYQLYSQYGNQDLKPEKSTSYEGGLDLELIVSKVTFTASFFKRDITDLIYFYSDPVTFASQYRTGNSQKDKGFELELNTNPTEKLSFNAWYAYVEGEGKDATGAVTEYLYRRPKNSFGANAGYSFNKALSLNLIYKYTGERSDPFYNNTTFKTDILTQRSFSLLDAYLQIIPTRRLTLFIDVKNLLDEKYVEWQGYNTRGRNFNAGIRYTIQ
ncbi:TonB-dependent receptor plug domain-containing protein [Rubrolithibacter danxiaensis]|uniref:TonB-dependent receptor plug domain-containing protein n=1 Tax=Rubrolithibacter danxiaensis TaxID=3390805 RepID=UPI003BF8AFE7